MNLLGNPLGNLLETQWKCSGHAMETYGGKQILTKPTHPRYSFLFISDPTHLFQLELSIILLGGLVYLQYTYL